MFFTNVEGTDLEQHPVDRMLEIHAKIEADATKLANRWLDAWGDSQMKGYRWAVNLKVDYKNKIITFQDAIRDRIGYWHITHSISTDYLKDDSNLEKDGQTWYLTDQEKRNKLFKRRDEIERSGDMQELKKIQEELSGGSIVSWPQQISI